MCVCAFVLLSTEIEINIVRGNEGRQDDDDDDDYFHGDRLNNSLLLEALLRGESARNRSDRLASGGNVPFHSCIARNRFETINCLIISTKLSQEIDK